jgi:2-methylcitrate dehydratase PrpD
MSRSLPPHPPTSLAATREPLAARLAEACVAYTASTPDREVIDKVKLCLMDLIGCACESRDLPWSQQASALAERVERDGATIIGGAVAVSTIDAAFANAVMAHGLVREDMHSGSISHLGIVVLPALLALSQAQRVSGAEFIAAAVVGYEVGAQVGRAVMDADIARIHRPTGITGPIAAAAASARLLGLNVSATTSALALGTNATAGFNQWAHTGGSEMFFQAGFAARNGMTAARLAAAGAFASPSALEGEAGLFAALGKPEAGQQMALFADRPEILSVYHKPVPACNFAQTPSLAALALARTTSLPAQRILAITVRVPRAGARYPGCDYRGPFAHILQAKMSIQYNVAAALLLGSMTEHNFTLLDDAELHRLISVTQLEIDETMTAAYPARQGGEVIVHEMGGAIHRSRLDNVINATTAAVRSRFRSAVEEAFGAARAETIERAINELERSEDAGELAHSLRANTVASAEHPR